MNSESNLGSGRKLKFLRNTMGMRSNAMAKMLKLDLAYFSRKENGFAPVKENEMKKVEELFKIWRDKEINLLKDRIDYLNSIK